MSWSVTAGPATRADINEKLDEVLERPEPFLSNPEGRATAKDLAPTALGLLDKIVDRDGALVGVTMNGHTDPDGATSVYVGAWLSG